jgi:hypothetical protein
MSHVLELSFSIFQKYKIKTFLEIHFFIWYLVFFKKKLETLWNVTRPIRIYSDGTCYVPKNTKYVGLFRKCFKLTKVAIVLNSIFKVKFIMNLIFDQCLILIQLQKII